MSNDARGAADAISVLRTLDERHPYRAVATGSYRPVDIDGSHWATANPLAVQILARDLNSPAFSIDNAVGRRSALCRYLSWLAADDEELLTPEIALSEVEIVRYLATDGVLRRSTHRSRVALRSVLRSFRAAFPELVFVVAARLSQTNEPTLAPIEDWEFDLAFEACSTFRDAQTRRNTRSVLVLTRAAGADGADLRWITGDAVRRVPGAGTWLRIAGPKAREVPVLERFAPLLEDLAEGRDGRTMVGNQLPPTASNYASSLTGLINRRLKRRNPTVTVSPERLRKAWLIEQIGANVPINTLLHAAGLTSLRTLEGLLDAAPGVPERPEHLAYELGGIRRRGRALSRDCRTEGVEDGR